MRWDIVWNIPWNVKNLEQILIFKAGVGGREGRVFLGEGEEIMVMSKVIMKVSNL